MKRAEKRGYLFNYDLPERPTRVTKKQLDLIRSVRPDTLYASADYIADYETGEVISGLEGRRLERHRAAVKAAETRQARRARIGGLSQGLKVATQERLCHIAVVNIRSLIRSLFGRPEVTSRPDVYYGETKNDKAGKIAVIEYISEIEAILNRAIAERGEVAVGQAIIDAPEDKLESLVDSLAILPYHKDYIRVTGEFAEVLKGSPLSVIERQRMEADFEKTGSWEEPE